MPLLKLIEKTHRDDVFVLLIKTLKLATGQILSVNSYTVAGLHPYNGFLAKTRNQLSCALFNSKEMWTACLLFHFLHEGQMGSVGGSVLRVILERLYHCVMSTHLLQTASKRSLKRDANENIWGGGAQVLLQSDYMKGSDVTSALCFNGTSRETGGQCCQVLGFTALIVLLLHCCHELFS